MAETAQAFSYSLFLILKLWDTVPSIPEIVSGKLWFSIPCKDSLFISLNP